MNKRLYVQEPMAGFDVMPIGADVVMQRGADESAPSQTITYRITLTTQEDVDAAMMRQHLIDSGARAVCRLTDDSGAWVFTCHLPNMSSMEFALNLARLWQISYTSELVLDVSASVTMNMHQVVPLLTGLRLDRLILDS